MKTENRLLAAFLLNLIFSILEFVGGMLTGSTAIASDALHDLGDAISIGVSYALEKKSKQPPDETYTYGYARYSVLGSVITTLILLLGSAAVLCNGVRRMLHPAEIHDGGMILLAVVGVCVNLGAVLFTCRDGSLNLKAVNLHLLEDVLGWIVVLVGAVVIRFTGFTRIDPIMSVGVAVFILIHAVKTLREAVELFLEKVPRGMDAGEIRAQLMQIDGVLDVHHLHLRSMDGQSHDATMHIVTDADPHAVKEAVREALQAYHITHVTLEAETAGEHCHERTCPGTACGHEACHHHHHHHQHHHHHH